MIPGLSFSIFMRMISGFLTVPIYTLKVTVIWIDLVEAIIISITFTHFTQMLIHKSVCGSMPLVL